MKISKEQQSVVAIVAGLLVIAWIKHNYSFGIVAGIIAVSFPFTFLNRPIHKAWMTVSKLLGAVSSHIILSILFYLFLVPISGLRKLLGKHGRMKDFPGNGISNFHPRNHVFNPKDFLNPW